MPESPANMGIATRSTLPPRSSSLAANHSNNNNNNHNDHNSNNELGNMQHLGANIDHVQYTHDIQTNTSPSRRPSTFTSHLAAQHHEQDEQLVATLALDSTALPDTTSSYTQPDNEHLQGGVPLSLLQQSPLPPQQQTTPEEDNEDDIDTRRPKKRKSVANLRAQASAQASTSKQTAAAPDDDDDDEDDSKSRRKINIEYIEEKSKRHITFSKRKAGIMKKAYELSTLTGTQVLLLVVSESGWVYTFTTEKFKPLVKEDENGQLSQGQKLIAACLEARDDGLPQANSRFRSPADGTFDPDLPHHGGQIALKPSSRGGPPGRMLATNRRVSGKGRSSIPAAIRTGSDQGLPQLPTPMSGYLDHNSSGLGSPISPRGPHSRSVSGGPISPRNPGYNQMQHPGGQQEWAQMMDMQQHAQHPSHSQHGQYDNNYDGMYSHGTPSPGLPVLPMHEQQQQGHPSDRYQPVHDHGGYATSSLPPQGHYTYQPDPNQHQSQRMYATSQTGGHHQQQQQQSNRGMTHAMYAQDDGTYVS